MPASLRRAASLAPEQALRGDVGFGAPSLLGYRGLGPSVHSVATATERGNGGHPLGDSDDDDMPALVDDDVPALGGSPDVDDDDGASESTPLLAGRGVGGGGASAASASASAASSSSHSTDLPDQETRPLQQHQRQRQEQQPQLQKRAEAKPKPPPPVLASFSREALEQRFCALLEYNASIAAVLPLVDFATAGQRGSLAHAIVVSKARGSSTSISYQFQTPSPPPLP